MRILENLCQPTPTPSILPFFPLVNHRPLVHSYKYVHTLDWIQDIILPLILYLTKLPSIEMVKGLPIKPETPVKDTEKEGNVEQRNKR